MRNNPQLWPTETLQSSHCLAMLMAFSAIFAATPSKADQFVARRPCIIHSESNSGSPGIGRIEIAQRATVLPVAQENKWIKVERNGVQGWVYKPRGEIIANDDTTTMRWWFGNIHAHTSEDSSESNVDESTHEDAFAYAMDDSKGNLDFLAVTPHNHLVGKHAYSKLLVTVRDTNFYQPGKFVPIAGQEFSSISAGNHINVFELDAWIDPAKVKNGRFDKLFLHFIPAHATQHSFAQFNHPYSRNFSAKQKKEYGRDDFPSMERWIEATDPYVQAIEIINAPDHDPATNRPHFDENKKRLDAWLWAITQGWHLGPTANQDNHRLNWGSASDSRTVAIAPALTLAGIIGAFQERRFYASEDSTMQVTFKAGDAWMGSILNLDGFGGFEVRVHDPLETSAMYNLELFEGTVHGTPLTFESEPDYTLELEDNEDGYFHISNPSGGTFYFLKVTQSRTPEDENRTADNAWTSPIWLVGEQH